MLSSSEPERNLEKIKCGCQYSTWIQVYIKKKNTNASMRKVFLYTCKGALPPWINPTFRHLRITQHGRSQSKKWEQQLTFSWPIMFVSHHLVELAITTTTGQLAYRYWTSTQGVDVNTITQTMSFFIVKLRYCSLIPSANNGTGYSQINATHCKNM